jgi:predicted acetyltransferase
MWTIRTVADEEVLAFRTTLMNVFGGDTDDDPSGTERLRALIEPTQRWAAFDGSHMVATAASFNFEMRIPGGSLPMAGLTQVTVSPSHRRQGILRALIAQHLSDAKLRGFAASTLWASESRIYRRFGYGIAAMHDELAIENAHSLNVVDGRICDQFQTIDESRARDLMPAIYQRATLSRPGTLHRSDVWWRERRFLEAPFVRAGASRRRYVLALRDGEPVGYVTYRQRGGFDEGLPSGKVEIVELIGQDAQAESSLWKFVLRVDLFPHVKWSNAPGDSMLPWIVDDSRQVNRRRTDNIWLRIDDVVAALQARSYSSDGTLRISVDGEATVELRVVNGRPHCEQVAEPAELLLSRPTLGSLFLGCVDAEVLANAGCLQASATTVAKASRLFGWPVAPWCPEIF